MGWISAQTHPSTIRQKEWCGHYRVALAFDQSAHSITLPLDEYSAWVLLEQDKSYPQRSQEGGGGAQERGSARVRTPKVCIFDSMFAFVIDRQDDLLIVRRPVDYTSIVMYSHSLLSTKYGSTG